ncbi:efflux RND transporter permease subunit [Variovorax sp. J22R133]|uniref:efflux RND transporter permease subunit n=1 Tax=Variovorax brevis TaxID=3053503 RepID=UPI00257819EB|nr:efflux RND transporter permease subunit [Variovorax sp. J22R133]MDM0113638.1 efflux RND transporter permease subunit [Variovorax sp. J22R133]
MARFFIQRPIFAIVLAILVMLAGSLSIFTLPVEQYPQIAPPTVQITTSYPGASATTVQDTVVQVIEQSMSGLDHLLYLSSSSDDTGQSTTTLTFAPGTNPDIAEVQVQNKLQLATPLLPAPVQQTGVRITKSSSASLLVAGFVSTDGSMNKFDIANYVVSHVQDPVSRIDGVGNLNVFGTQYAIRIWLDTRKLYSYALTPVDVTTAVTNQNVQVSAGQLGGAPAVGNQQLTATITAATLLRTPQDFGAILLKVLPDGSQVRLRDVSRIELGAENFAVDTRYNGKPAAGIAVQLATGANALQTATAVRGRIEELSKYFPPGLKVVYPNDSTPFIRESIKEVVKTLFEGIALVFLVMLLFLQNIRATIIPTIAVPVVLLGTFGVMAALGFTVNTLSMFGLVLAVGLLVDDAIVVVENVERVMQEEGLSAPDATRKAMGQISGALIGVAMVLCAVFVPVAFSGGTVGAIYRQFSLTIVSAMLLSVFVALTLTPALCAMILKPAHDPGAQQTGFFGWFNRSFDRSRDGYLRGVRHVIGRAGRWFAIYAAIIAAVGWMFVHLPTSFLPTEDQGFLYIQVQTPPGATMERTGGVLETISDYLAKDEADTVEASFLVNGFNFAGRGQSQGLLYVQLKDWHQRTKPAQNAEALTARLAKHFATYKDAVIIPITPPAIQGLGTAAGFDFELQDRGGVGHEKLMQALDKLLDLARHDPDLALVRPNGLADNPTFKVDVDREKASALGVAITDADQAFSTAWGSKYVNNFLDTDGRIKKVYVQADAPFRMNPEDLDRLYVRNAQGGMTPFSSFATGTWTYGPPQLQRYNGVPAVEIQGQAAPGRSTGQAIAAMERLMKQMPLGIGFEWTGVSLQQQQSGSQAPYFYALSILVVFLCLAALYESWSIPLSVMLVIPLGVLGALGLTTLFGLSNDVYFQVGLLTTIGLSAKNAILIVEFARDLQASGRSALEAAVEAAHMRLRPIVMTSLAFGLGVLPLALARGAGSASQNAIGVCVIGGMGAATFLAIFMIPMFYVVVAGRLARTKPVHAPAPVPALQRPGTVIATPEGA